MSRLILGVANVLSFLSMNGITGIYFWPVVFLAALIVYGYEKKRNKPQADNFVLTKALEAHFTDNQLQCLRQNLPSSELETFNSILIPSLIIIKKILSDLTRGKSAPFEALIDVIVALFNDLNRDPDLFKQQNFRIRDRLILVFLFYRVLQCHYVLALDEYGQFEEGFDRDLLFKRLPHQLYQLLGVQSWRLLELSSIVHGDLEHIHLNQDLVPILKKTDFYSPETNKVSVVSEVTIDPSIVPPFYEWLLMKLDSNDKHFKINQGGLVFCDLLVHGEDIVFITDEVFRKYQSIENIDPELLRSSLIEKKLSQEGRFSIQDGDACYQSVKIQNVFHDQEVLNSVTIKEEVQ